MNRLTMKHWLLTAIALLFFSWCAGADDILGTTHIGGTTGTPGYANGVTLDGTTIDATDGVKTRKGVTATGTVTGSNISGTNTGDQTITLSGDVGGTGTGAITATIQSNAVGSAEVADGSLTADDLGADSVAASEIATSAVGTDEVNNNTLTSDDLGTDSVAADEIVAGAVNFVEMQQIATDKLLGRVSPSTGTVEEIGITDFVQTLLAATTDADFRTLIGVSAGTGDAVLANNETIMGNWVNTDNPWADDEVADTLTASIVKGSGTTTDAVDLATAEVAGVLPDANVANDITINTTSALTAPAGTFSGNLTGSNGTVVSGVTNSVRGIYYASGNATTSDGIFEIQNGGGANDANTDIWRVGGDGTGDFVILGSGGASGLGNILEIDETLGHGTFAKNWSVAGDIAATGVIKSGSPGLTLTDPSDGKVLSASLKNVAIADGGTGGTTPAAARTNLGITGWSDTARAADVAGVAGTAANVLLGSGAHYVKTWDLVANEGAVELGPLPAGYANEAITITFGWFSNTDASGADDVTLNAQILTDAETAGAGDGTGFSDSTPTFTTTAIDRMEFDSVTYTPTGSNGGGVLFVSMEHDGTGGIDDIQIVSVKASY